MGKLNNEKEHKNVRAYICLMCYEFNFDALKTKRMLDQESDLLDLYRGVSGAPVVEDDGTLSFVQMFLKNVGVFEGCIEAHSNGSGLMI